MKGVLFRIFLLLIFVGILASVIAFARGYRINVEQKSITPTGILVASSFPDGAKIYVDGKLKGATNTNLTLAPGTYNIEIKKEGYRSWKKNINIQGEIVIKTDSLLFPQNPSLSPSTSLGIINAKFSPSTNRIVFISNTTDKDKDGVYMLDNSRRALTLFNPLRLLVLKSSLPQDINYKNTQFEFSSDDNQLIFSVCPTLPDNPKQLDCTTPIYSYLLSAETEKQLPLAVTGSEQTILDGWTKDEQKNIKKILETFKDPIPKIASDSFHILSIAPDDSKILYRATEPLTIPLIITPPLIGANQTQETRTLQKNHLYVYDKKEDKNYEIPLSIQLPSPFPSPSPLIPSVTPSTIIDTTYIDSLQDKIIWFPDSRHLIINEGKQVSIIDYDGNTKQTVYSGPFDTHFMGVNNDGNLLILANLNPNENQYPDVYTVGIR